jgi:hypothetical protein
LTPSILPGKRNANTTSMSLVVGGSDDCSAPDAISGLGQFVFDLTSASTGAEGQNETICYQFGSSSVDNDVWFAWTATTTDTFIVEICNLSSADTKLAAYPGSACPTPGSSLACNDDTCSLQSQISFPATAGSTYVLQVGNFPGAAAGTGSIDISAFQPASNDDCSTPTAISGVGIFSYDQTAATTGAEGQAESLCYSFGTSAIENDVWFAWTAPSTDLFKFETCSLSSSDTRLAVYPGASCPGTGTALACNDDFCTTQSHLTFNGTAGSSYMLQVGTFPGATTGTGSFDLGVFQTAPNDDCSSPTAISGQGNFTFNNSVATTGVEGQTEYLCYLFGTSAVDRDVWFSWTPDATGVAQMTTCNLTSVDTKLAAYPGGPCPTNGSSIACNEDSCAFQSTILFACVQSQPVLLQLGCFPGAAPGSGSFDITIGSLATNDDCTNSIAIAGQGTFNWSNVGASIGPEGQSEGICYQYGVSEIENDVWFRWTSDATGQAVITTCEGSVNDTKISAHTAPTVGACVSAGSSLACNDDACDYQSTITFAVTQGTDYILQLGSYPGTATFGVGTFEIEIPCETCGPGTAFCLGDDTGSTPCPCGNPSTNGGGCANGSGGGGTLSAVGSASVSADTLVLQSTSLLANQPCLFFQGNNAINGGGGIHFGDGLRCAGGGVIRLQVRFPDANGDVQTSLSVSVKGGCAPGDVKRYQNWYRDPGSSVCGALFNLTNGYEITWLP